jgi:hypothetical protein
MMQLGFDYIYSHRYFISSKQVRLKVAYTVDLTDDFLRINFVLSDK